jgi:hypothetical protein
MTDLLPSPPPLDDVTRDRIRARLRTSIDAERTTRRGWLVPSLAAAAVLAAVAAGVVASGRATPNDAQPAGQGGGGKTAVSGPSTGARHHQKSGHREHVVRKHVTVSHHGLGVQQSAPPPSCASQIEGATVPEASTYAESASIPHDGGTTSLWTGHGHWLVCDQWQVPTGITTILHVTPDAAPLSRDLFTVSTNSSPQPRLSTEYIAGGRVPDGVHAISYRFSDGHTQDAVLHDGMWAMVYLPTSGPYNKDVAPTGATTQVRVTKADGSTVSYTLTLPLDFCAQVNHGC